MVNVPLAMGDPAAVERTIEVLDAGGLVVLPTDTVYGLAARAHDPSATARIFEAKGRRDDVPVAVLCADAEQALGLAGPVPPRARRLAADHWPGPLTMVLPRRRDLGWALGEPSHTIGLRCPDHDLVRTVARSIGPIATTSANRHGEATPDRAADAAAQLLIAPDLVVDGGRLGGAASTVIAVDEDGVRILRPGPVVVDPD